jgi:hypothetical protein
VSELVMLLALATAVLAFAALAHAGEEREKPE